MTAEYDAGERTLHLAEPLEGVNDHAKVQVLVTLDPESIDDPDRPWLAFEGKLSKEAGAELARAVDELFPPWK